MAESGGKVNQKRDEAFSNVGSRTASVRDDLWEKAFESLHTKSRKNFTETLGSSLQIKFKVADA